MNIFPDPKAYRDSGSEKLDMDGMRWIIDKQRVKQPRAGYVGCIKYLYWP